MFIFKLNRFKHNFYKQDKVLYQISIVELSGSYKLKNKKFVVVSK